MWEWCTGLRLVHGELQILQDNNAASPTADLSASSKAWKAIDATTGDLVTPNGSGTTANTVKLDYVSSKWKYVTTITSSEDSGRSCQFKDITCDAGIGADAKLLLQALAMLPDAELVGDKIDANYGGDYFYANNAQEERWLVRGGYWDFGADAGVFSSALSSPRSYVYTHVGGRSALIE